MTYVTHWRATQEGLAAKPLLRCGAVKLVTPSFQAISLISR